MINKTLSGELAAFFEQYLTFYREFLDLEMQKYDDMSRNNLKSLDGHVKSEQAYMLKSKGLEIERDRLIEKAGASKTTFRELIPMLDESVRDRVQELYKELSDVLQNLKEINIRNNYITELRLHKVEINLKKLENHPELQKVYNGQAHEGSRNMNILSKKI